MRNKDFSQLKIRIEQLFSLCVDIFIYKRTIQYKIYSFGIFSFFNFIYGPPAKIESNATHQKANGDTDDNGIGIDNNSNVCFNNDYAKMLFECDDILTPRPSLRLINSV